MNDESFPKILILAYVIAVILGIVLGVAVFQSVS